MSDDEAHYREIEQKVIAIENEADGGGNRDLYEYLRTKFKALQDSIDYEQLDGAAATRFIELFDRCTNNLKKSESKYIPG